MTQITKILDVETVYSIGKSNNIPTIIWDTRDMVFKNVSLNIRKSTRKVVKNDITKNIFVFRKPEQAEAKEIQKNIKVELNKLSANNIEIITERLIKLMIDDNMTYYIISCLFNQAIQDSMYCKLYTELFASIAKNKRKLILKLIEEKKTVIEKLLENKVDSAEETETYDDFCDYVKNKKTLNDIYLFISELYKKQLLNKKILEGYISTLFQGAKNNMDTENRPVFIECITKILTETNNEVIFRKYRKRVENILKYLTENKKMREKFMIQDLLDKYSK